MITLVVLAIILILAVVIALDLRRDPVPATVEREPVCPQCGSEITIGVGLGGLRNPWAICTNKQCNWHR